MVAALVFGIEPNTPAAAMHNSAMMSIFKTCEDFKLASLS
jgi:hypothetical protein